jgi:hypothetical protein
MIDNCCTQTIMKLHILALVFQYRAYERRVLSVHRSGALRAMKAPVNL